MDKERNSPEVRRAWADWFKEKTKKFQPEDCWFATLSFGKNPPGIVSFVEKKLYQNDKKDLDAETLRKRFIVWLETEEGFGDGSIGVFWVDPKGSMGNRHYHMIMSVQGLGKVGKDKWASRWSHYAGKGSSAVISQSDDRQIDYMTNDRNLGTGEVKIRGQVP